MPNEPSDIQSLQKFLVPQESTQQPHIPKPYLDALLTNNEHRAPKPATPHYKHNKQPSPNSHAYFLRPQLDLSNHMTFNSDITSTWRASDEILFQTNNEGNFKVATWNCNHMTETKAEYIAWYVASMEIDVLFIQDTRLTPVMYKAISYRLKTLLGGETFIASSIKAHTNHTVGGQLVIVNSNLKQKIDGLWSDTTGLGLAMSITIDTTGSKLQIMSTYWPAKPTGEESGGLHNATLEVLRKSADGRKPLEFIQDSIARRLIDHQANPDYNFIVVGDLNSRWFPGTAGIHGSCKDWADSLSLSNDIADNTRNQGGSIFTRFSGDNPTGHIDHILTYGELLTTAYGTTNQHFWRLCSDHRPLWAQFKFNYIRDQRIPIHRPTPSPSTKFDERDEALTKNYKDLLDKHSGLNINIDSLNTQQKDLLLEQICLLSVNIVESHNLKHKKSKKKRRVFTTIFNIMSTATCLHGSREKNAGNRQETKVDC